tara:strand:+ start:87 stop:299 length:213 start_codon:yes stop_codon:yes gene_type:complete
MHLTNTEQTSVPKTKGYETYKPYNNKKAVAKVYNPGLKNPRYADEKDSNIVRVVTSGIPGHCDQEEKYQS